MVQAVVKKNILYKLFGFFRRKKVYHGLFWLGLILLFTAISMNERGFWFHFSNESINVFFYALIIYFNVYYLIPNYLTQKNFLLYCALLLVATITLTPVKVLILFFKLEAYPTLQNQLVQNQYAYFLSMFLIAGASTIVKIVRDWMVHQRERKELETRTMQTELKFLRSQINPHFLFNTLNNLYALTLKKDDSAPEIVIKLSEMMRYMLYECNERWVLLKKEMNYMQNYLDLEKLRQGENIDIRFELNGDIRDQMIAPLLFIPFLENSFKHGLNHHIESGYVHISIEVDGINLFFVIENSKVETTPVQIHRKSGGIGLVNVRKRLNLLYPNKYDLKITDSPKKYRVELNLTLNE